MSKYSVVGVSRLNGEVKVRFAHDLAYVKGLTKAGNTDVELLEAPTEMDKPELTEWLKTTELYQNAEFKEAIDSRLEMYAVKAGKATKSVKEPKTAKVAKTTKTAKTTTKGTKAKPSLEAIKARHTKKAEVAAE